MRKVYFMMALMLMSLSAIAQKPSDTPVSQMEKLDRGLIVVRVDATHCFLSWRLLGTDDKNTTFRVLKNGSVLRDKITGATSFQVTGKSTDKFQVVTLQNGEVIETSPEVSPWSSAYLTLQLDRPTASDCTYSPNDCSVGDVDGDGQYEIFVKWDPSNSQDNSNSGVTGIVYIDCYKLDGTKLWRIDLGKNIRAGAHYTQFMVYDFDKDGKAEMICKTAPGSKDGVGNYVNQAATDDKIKSADNSKDHRTSAGRINGGQEYLTVFDGQTGAAIHTIAYYPNRNAKAELSDAAGTLNWGAPDSKNDTGTYGNRGERYLAAVAYLDGADQKPSGIFSRGYYGYAYIWAVDFDGQQLKHKWLHSSTSKTQYTVTDSNMNQTTYVPGASTSIIWGSAALDDDGKLLYSVGFGHGDAIHLADLNPDRPGLELFDIHEDGEPYAWDVHDAATGEILLKGGQEGIDNGRGCAADIVADSRGYEFWSAYGGFDSSSRNQNPLNVISGKVAGSTMPSMNFRIYWDGDEYDELLDDITITKYPSSTALGVGRTAITGQSNNSTKATPCLMADIFGDWREELIVRSNSDDALNIFSTVTTTSYRVPTLMHDHTYRMGVAWQNVGYNQPPHLGYYLPDYIKSFEGVTTAIQSIEVDEIAHRQAVGEGRLYS